MAIDIRDYLPPSLKHVLVYTSQAEREKREREAREGFGRPTPVPLSEAPDDTDETTLKREAASPWPAESSSRVDKEALPSALMPPPAAPRRAKRQVARVRVVSLRIVAVATLVGLVGGGIVIARAMRGSEGVRGGATATVTANAVVPSATAGTSATAIPSVAPSPSTGVSGAPAVPSSTATAAPSATVSAKARPSAVPDDPYDDRASRPPPAKTINEDKPVF